MILLIIGSRALNNQSQHTQKKTNALKSINNFWKFLKLIDKCT